MKKLFVSVFFISFFFLSGEGMANNQNKKIEVIHLTSKKIQHKKIVPHSSAHHQPVVTIKDKKIRSKPVVILDPGHGGHDPGAGGPQKNHEKNVVLAISRELKKALESKNIAVAMTRDKDIFVTLRGRLLVARKNHGDIFVAIHADSYLNNTAHGASVFTLSQHGASSEAARWLARNENSAVLAGAKFHDNSKEVQSILLNLSQAATISDSIALGKNVVNALAKITDLHVGHLEQAPFMVLKSPDIPSILIETGFISNADEEARLSSTEYQHKIALAIANGIASYFKQHPAMRE